MATRAQSCEDRPAVPAAFARALRELGLAGEREPLSGEPLTGGVSSDIWRIDAASHGPVCAKRALPQLRVAATWRAPIGRYRYEARWMSVANAAVQDMARGKPSEIDHVDVTVACLRE